MFQNAAVDVAIGLTLTYGTLSLLCTVVNEFLATQLDLRAKNLVAGLQELLDDPVVRNAFYDHGLISGTNKALANSSKMFTRWRTMRIAAVPADAWRVEGAPATGVARTPASGPPSVPTAAGAVPSAVSAAPAGAPIASIQSRAHPSYVSSETFTLALVGALTGTRLAQGTPTPGFADVQTAIEELPPSKIKSALQASLLSAQGDFNAFRMSVATWFDDSMDRLSGAYKRHLKLISIFVGCVAAIGMNVDTFVVTRSLWVDGDLRAKIVQASNAAITRGESAEAGTLTEVGKVYKAAAEEQRPLPVGWPIRGCPCAALTPAYAWFLIVKLFGWFVTGIALSLGAPFWFDLLSKFINIRGAGVKPDRQDAKEAN
jgi:hypothetical protein